MSDRLPRSLLLPGLPRPVVVGHIKDQPISIEYVRKLTDALKSNHTQVAERIEELTDFGDAADLPDASGAGRFFFEQDTDKLKFDDGTWNLVGGTGGFLPLSGGTMTGHLILNYVNPYIVLSDSDQPSLAYNTVLQDRYDGAAGSSAFLWKKCLLGIPTLHLDAIATDGSSIGVIKMFRSCNTTGAGTHFTIYNATNSETPQHTFLAKGDASLCQQAGTFKAGSTGNEVQVETDGHMKFNGTATVWDDMRVPVLATKVPAAAGPSFGQVVDDGSGSTGVFCYWFSPTTEEQLYFMAQLPHGYKHGSDLECHVHWVPADTAGVAGTDVCWGLEYTWANINSVFGNTALAYGDEQTNGATETLTLNKHYLTEIVTIDGDPAAVDYTFSSMLICRIFRDATGTGGTDDYDDDAGLLEIDFHYQADSIGSNDEYTKD